MDVVRGNVGAGLPEVLPAEIMETLVSGTSFRLERIVSEGHASPEGFWYNQDEHEFVVVVAGSAVLDFEDSSIVLGAGDWVIIPAHCRHRVARTSDSERTFWLAVFWTDGETLPV